MMKWEIELSEYNIQYKPQLSLKVQVLAKFIVELPQRWVLSDNEQWLILHVDEASRTLGGGIGLTLQSPTGKQIEQVVCSQLSKVQ